MRTTVHTVSLLLVFSATVAAQDLPRFGTGLLLPSEAQLRKIQIQKSDLFGAAKLPTRVSWRSELPSAGNQGNYNSCVAWSLGYGLLSFLKGKENPRNPVFVYHWSRLNDMNGKGSTTSEIKDEGSSFDAGFQALVNNGSCDLRDYTDFRASPRPDVAKKAKKYRADLKTPAQPLDVSDIYTLKRCLSEHKVLPAGFRIYAKFEDPKAATESVKWQKHPKTKQEVPVWKNMGAPRLGLDKHAMLVTGYDDDLHAFEVLNSYGEQWGDHGYIWIDYDFFGSLDKDSSACCICIFDYQNSLRGVFGIFGEKKKTPDEVYVKLASRQWEPLTPWDINFQIPEARDIDDIHAGDRLTLKPGFNTLFVRDSLVTDPATGNTTLGKQTGSLRSGDHFKVSELHRIVLDKGRKVEYWTKGSIEKK